MKTKENKTKIYVIYDDITRAEYIVKCTEKQLINNGCYEFEGRFRYTLYDDNINYTTVEGKKVISFNSFKKNMRL